ncbi:YqcC family protein [Aestuariibacter halophilus]|uniref:YqcC family protein n=1 Tax=Fluctibacter halophilus TaxID=226011 RepID=A0ABS8GDH1_9ALTE|nr:YqcC family protein [Aestuariibacter halophilus]MCC2618156.1 YqcC family protein [Aestuariibacter halophilus]
MPGQNPPSPVEMALISLADALQRAGLWSDTPPSPQALASQAPFACDHLPFEGWLQHLFIPRLRAMLAAGDTLPATSGIAAMGEVVWQDHHDYAQVMIQLREIDTLLQGQYPGEDKV